MHSKIFYELEQHDFKLREKEKLAGHPETFSTQDSA